MVSFKGHFDGKSIVLDEPAPLQVGQEVDVVVRNVSASDESAIISPPAFSLDYDPSLLPPGVEYNERDYVRAIEQKYASVKFERKLGSGKGEIRIADDFDETPEEFKDYM